LIDKNSYLLELARYIALNPVRARMVRSAKEWRWSSYRATVGQQAKPSWLNTECLLAGFGRRKSKAIEAYKRFVSAGKCQPSPWAQLRNQVFLGNEKFVKSMQRLIDVDKVTCPL